MEHRFHTLDVFTTTRFQGNPLAVFTDGDSLSNDQMQAIAREMNLAETVFVQKPTDERALARHQYLKELDAEDAARRATSKLVRVKMRRD